MIASIQFFRSLPCFCLTLCIILAGGCRSPDSTATNSKTKVSFLIAGDTAGWIVPCGCTTKQSGGLLRRGSLVSQMTSETPPIVLDVGGAAAGKSDYHRAKLEAILLGEIKMGLAAHNIGASELAFGASVIRQLESDLAVPFISANVMDSNGELVTEPMKIVSQGGSSFAVIGVIDPMFASGDLHIKDPRQSILDLLDQIDEPIDGIVVLAYLPRESLMELAKQLPEVDAVIGGPTGQTVAATQFGATWVASSTNKGKFVVQLQFDPGEANRWSADVVEVDDSLADDPIQTANLALFHEVLEKADFDAAETGLSNLRFVSSNSDNQFAGNRSCSQCHSQDGTHYASTKHSVAWETLQAKRSQVDPYCQQCHTTGFGAKTGFASIAKTPNLFDVGCESCHGPSSRHVEDPKVRTVFIAQDQCVQCHDRENSPAFEYNSYWQRIVHGAKRITNEASVNQ